MRHKYTIITYYSNVTSYKLIFITCRPNAEGKWGGANRRRRRQTDRSTIGAWWAWPGWAWPGHAHQAPYVQFLATPLIASYSKQHEIHIAHTLEHAGKRSLGVPNGVWSPGLCPAPDPLADGKEGLTPSPRSPSLGPSGLVLQSFWPRSHSAPIPSDSAPIGYLKIPIAMGLQKTADNESIEIKMFLLFLLIANNIAANCCIINTST